ncbi:NADH-quinone oxidoreductase subunit H [Nocardia farcinica]|uniref:complex I subunit 1 family protein n=1 Tax=Nocardia TaxID=1817 RepID=UPI001895D8D0|nr:MULTISPECIES: complex I subunit 1 family protein [Nocardia]MBF6289941.1 NADH-quinone oxidoreductase subunit H [Nocardia cyriacigeorgica]MBF6422215.1 NADH-quinone oxidoreductase subunit H [Nocardia farcinica]MBF6433871.1 NADH-quinone oxidoreductase subunit H [Nocardia farcinica]MBF6504939.1 NADH-quinone oxidoreductase subunit H [Nocardia farcinica]
MVEAAQWWQAALLPVAVVAFALAVDVCQAVLTARVSGSSVSVAASTPVRTVALLLTQQRRSIVGADVLLWRSAGLILFAGGVLTAALVPVGDRVVLGGSVSLVWFNAAEICSWAAVWLAGWGADSAFSLVGGYRFVAQGLAYELPHMFALICAAVAAGSLDISDIVAAQQDRWFVVIMPVAFVIYLLSVPALSFAAPFDAPVGVGIAGGVFAEVSGVDRLVLTVGRRVLFVAAAAMAVPLFLGGGAGPWLPGWLWSLVKTLVVLAALIWLGRRWPTIRMSRYMEVAWIVLVPVILLQALVVSIVMIR